MGPRFKLDENLPSDARELLRNHGYDAETALAEQLGGAVDTADLNACRVEGRVLGTLDLGFADIRAYPPASHRGGWVLRPAQQTIQGVGSLLSGAVRILPTEATDGRLWIIEAERIRIRQ